tara:strand:+ start:2154 stop:2861 length:708 start_codon:yes stop_codon:yes gene_type:complete
MRKINKNLVLLLFAFTTLISCEEPVHQSPNESVDPPKQIISVSQAKEMYDSYEKRRIGIIKDYEGPNPDGTEFEPTRYGWYDYETIKQYIAYIDQEAKEAGVKISGLKLYFSNYPDADNFEDGSPVAYKKQNSFFIVPTLNENGNHRAFITADDGHGGRTPVLVKNRIRDLSKARSQGRLDYLDSKKKYYSVLHPRMLLLNFSFQDDDNEDGDRSLVLNEASLVPPPPQDTDMDD